MLVTLGGLVIVVASALYIAWPLLKEGSGADPTEQRSEASALAREKDAALEAIREVDFDHRVGKMSDEDHAKLRADLEQRALAALAALDERGQDEPGLRAIAGHASSTGTDGGGGFCPDCGNRFKREARFCMGCGKKLPEPAGARGRRRANS